MPRRSFGGWPWIAASGALAFILFCGLTYYRVWGSRVIFYAVGEILFFLALIACITLFVHVARLGRREERKQ